MTAGRPTLYKPEYCEQIVEFGKRGLNFLNFAVSIDVDRSTITEWTKVHPEFSIAFAKAKDAQEGWLIERGLAACNGNSAISVPMVKFMLSAAHGWRDKDQAVTNIHIGKDTKDVSFPAIDEPPA